MADGKNPRKWSLEEIDELLQDSGMLPRDDESLYMVEEIAPAQKTEVFDPRPSHNEKISHKIISDTVEKSDSIAEPQVYGNFVSEKYRERFFTAPVKNIEKATDKTIVISEDGNSSKDKFLKNTKFSTIQLEKINKQKDIEKTRVQENLEYTKTIGLRSLAVTDGDAHEIELPEEEDNMQLSFEGFHEEEIEHIDESEVEKELIKKRKEKVSSFTIAGEITQEQSEEGVKKYGTDEYRTADEKFKVAYYLKKEKSTAFAGMIVSFVCAFILLIVSLTAQGLDKGGIGYIILSLVFTLIPSGCCYNFLFDGIKTIKKFKFNRNTGCFFAIVAAVIQQFVFMTSSAPFEKGLSLLSGAAIMYLGLNMFGEYSEYKRISENFSFLSNQEDIYSIGIVEDDEVASQIGKGIQEPVILSSQKTVFPRRFIEFSKMYYPSDDVSDKSIKIGLVASVAVGVITLIISKSVLFSVTGFTAAIIVCMPYLSYICDSIAIKTISSYLRKKGAMVAGWQSLKMCDKANAIAVDAEDVFRKDGGDVHGIHPFYDIGIDEAIIYAATLTIAAGGPMGNLFKRVIVGETKLLPPVDGLTYEDKLGLSAWIFNRKILVGSEDMLRNHNVEIPDMALINRHLTSDRYPVYLAIDGKAAAVFIISYDADQQSKKLLRKIEENNISLLVRANDPNVTDTVIAQKLTLPQSGVKVISAIAGETLKEYVRETTSTADSLLIHTKTEKSFLQAVKSSLSLDKFKSILRTFQLCATGIGIAVVAALSFIAGVQHIDCTQIMLIQLLFTAVSVFSVTGGFALKDKRSKK